MISLGLGLISLKPKKIELNFKLEKTFDRVNVVTSLF